MKASYEKFAKLLEEKGITPYKVHQMTGIATATLSDWKNGKSTPKTDKLSKIAEALGVSVNYFYEETEEIDYVIDNVLIEAYKNQDSREKLIAYAKALLKMQDMELDVVVPFPQYPGVTKKDIQTFAARNAKEKFSDEEIAGMIYEMKKED